MTVTRVCSHCRHRLPLEAFGMDRSQCDQLTRQCKPCRSEMRKASYQRHRENRLKAVADYQHARRDEIIERKRQRYAANKIATQGKTS